MQLPHTPPPSQVSLVIHFYFILQKVCNTLEINFLKRSSPLKIAVTCNLGIKPRSFIHSSGFHAHCFLLVCQWYPVVRLPPSPPKPSSNYLPIQPPCCVPVSWKLCFRIPQTLYFSRGTHSSICQWCHQRSRRKTPQSWRGRLIGEGALMALGKHSRPLGIQGNFSSFMSQPGPLQRILHAEIPEDRCHRVSQASEDVEIGICIHCW